MGYVTFLAAPVTGNPVYGSRYAGHSRVYLSFPFALHITLVNRVTRFFAVTTPIHGLFFSPVSLLLGYYLFLFH
jgi:hypothetical protein